MTNPPDQDIDERLAEQVLETVHLVRRYTRRAVGVPFDSPSLSPAHGEVMRHVSRNPGSSVKEVAAALGLAPNTVSTLVATLVDTGMIQRATDTHDARVARLSLSPTAIGPLGVWRRKRLATVSAAVKRLGPEEHEQLAAGLAVLEKLAEFLDESEQEA